VSTEDIISEVIPVRNIIPIWVLFLVVKEEWIFAVVLASVCEQAWKCSERNLLICTALPSSESSQVVHMLHQTVTLLLNVTVNIPFIFSNKYAGIHIV
jgi:hypothetical protein